MVNVFEHDNLSSGEVSTRKCNGNHDDKLRSVNVKWFVVLQSSSQLL